MRTKNQRAREEGTEANGFVDDGNKRIRTYSEDHREERRRKKTNVLPDISDVTAKIADATILESDEDQPDGARPRSRSRISHAEKYKRNNRLHISLPTL